MALERASKRTFRFKEQAPEGEEAIGTLYVQKRCSKAKSRRASGLRSKRASERSLTGNATDIHRKSHSPSPESKTNG